MEFDRLKIKIRGFEAELPEPLDRCLRTLVTAECEIFSEDFPDNQDGTFNRVWRAKVCGTTLVKQGDKKPIASKSKRSQSQRLRAKLWSINSSDEFYEAIMDKIIFNAENVIEFLKDK